MKVLARQVGTMCVYSQTPCYVGGRSADVSLIFERNPSLIFYVVKFMERFPN